MTCCGQGSCSAQDFVHWDVIDALGWFLSVSLWYEPNQRKFHVKLLWLGFIQHVGGLVPSCSFDVEAVTEDAVNWLFGDILWLDFVIDFEVIREFIDGDGMLSCIVLTSTGKESLWEEESRQPKSWWATILNPLLDELNSFVHISDP